MLLKVYCLSTKFNKGLKYFIKIDTTFKEWEGERVIMYFTHKYLNFKFRYDCFIGEASLEAKEALLP